MGCAVAAAAMLSDTNYDEVAGHWPDLDEANVRARPREFRLILESLTEIDWNLSDRPYPCQPVHNFSFPDWPVAVFIRDAIQRPRFGMWVVVKRDIVHDPGELGPYVVSRYPHRDWFVTCVAEPARPEKLAGYLARSRRRKVATALQSLTLDCESHS